MRGVYSAAFGGFVHHVVMVEGCQVGEFYHYGRFEHVVVYVPFGGGGEQGQQRAHAFTSGEQQVA